MAKREIADLELKVKLTNEYLDNGGLDSIWDIDLLSDLEKVDSDENGNVDPDTVSSRVNSFMLSILGSHMIPPFYSPDYISEYESTLQKSNSFDQKNIDTQEQFDKIYEEYKSKADFLFRGQREAKWRLYSKLQRHWILDKIAAKGISYQILLETLVNACRSEYKREMFEILGESHNDSDNDIAVLGFLQHHGCPTPLLDWTYKFQNALFFAIDGLESKVRHTEIDDYFSIYFIQEKDFEKGGMRTLIYQSIEALQERLLNEKIARVAKDEETRKQMEAHFKGRKIVDTKKLKGSGLIAHMTKINNMINFPATYFGDGRMTDDIIFSINNSKNIQNQMGVFTWNADPTKPFEIVVNEQNKEELKEEQQEKDFILCACFNINKKLADYIKARLKEDGVTKDLIYPTPEINTWHIYENGTN